MVNLLSKEEIIFINEVSLKLTDEEDKFYLEYPDDLDFLIDLVKKDFKDDFYKSALWYCISIIVLHPFKNGNHRTSILAAEHFLLKNNFQSFTDDEKDTWLEKYRIEYEKEYELERDFFRIACIENRDKQKEEIKNIMISEYGKTIKRWLKKNYKTK
jgi:prophage maintenance system killer protein